MSGAGERVSEPTVWRADWIYSAGYLRHRQERNSHGILAIRYSNWCMPLDIDSSLFKTHEFSWLVVVFYASSDNLINARKLYSRILHFNQNQTSFATFCRVWLNHCKEIVRRWIWFWNVLTQCKLFIRIVILSYWLFSRVIWSLLPCMTWCLSCTA